MPNSPTPIDLLRSTKLSQLILEHIRIYGPISFAEFMEYALYTPKLGYYEAAGTLVPRVTSLPQHTAALGLP